jgi:hypothetical protein
MDNDMTLKLNSLNLKIQNMKAYVEMTFTEKQSTIVLTNEETKKQRSSEKI